MCRNRSHLGGRGGRFQELGLAGCERPREGGELCRSGRAKGAGLHRAHQEWQERLGQRPVPQEAEERREAQDKARTSAIAYDLQKATLAAADKARQEAKQVRTEAAVKVMLIEARLNTSAQILADLQRVCETCDSLVGLDLLVQATAATLPPMTMMALKAELRKVLAPLHATRPYVATIAADRNRAAVEEWRARLGQLMG
jgi:hypothetical protein